MPNIRFPRSTDYEGELAASQHWSGANSLWLTEWLTAQCKLEPGMRILDLGCGHAMSSVFLAREFGVKVWAVDRWHEPSDNFRLFRKFHVQDSAFPIKCSAHLLPFAKAYFDAIFCIDSYQYFGTDDYYATYLAQFLKPEGTLGIAGASLLNCFDEDIPMHLKEWWIPEAWSFHPPSWWKRHLDKSGLFEVELADSMKDGWEVWLEWQRKIFPENLTEIRALESDQGTFLGYIRIVSRRKADREISIKSWSPY